MSEMASGYRGPHKVSTIRNSRNLGGTDHGIARGREASGEIVVGAAGDDVSEPERTSRIVDAFKSDSNAGAVFSAVSIIDETSKTIAAYAKRPLHGVKPRIFLDKPNSETVIQGCSAAYKRWVFDIPLSTGRHSYAEDIIFSFYLNILESEILYIDAPLVRYRTHSAAASNYLSPDPAEHEKRLLRSAGLTLEIVDEFERLAASVGKSHALRGRELAVAREFARDQSVWPHLTFPQRLIRTLKSAFEGDFRFSLRRGAWRTVRLWGQFPNYQPKMSVSPIQRKYRLRGRE